ncbi:hypothetical protein K439DRAFT_1617851 [Ramaria rubella]|nr:hypothetical protein K439DRAFT_1617851 [Ramaria rubella]
MAGQDHVSNTEQLWDAVHVSEREETSGIEDVLSEFDEADEVVSSPKWSPQLAEKSRCSAQASGTTVVNPSKCSWSTPSGSGDCHPNTLSSAYVKHAWKVADKTLGKHHACEAFDSNLEVAKTERLGEKQKAQSSERMAKITLKQRKMELEFEERWREQDAIRQEKEWSFWIHLAALQGSVQVPTPLVLKLNMAADSLSAWGEGFPITDGLDSTIGSTG